jgi:hypothetical protein
LGTALEAHIVTFRILFDVTHNPRRVSGHDSVGWDIFSYDAASAPDRVLADAGVA